MYNLPKDKNWKVETGEAFLIYDTFRKDFFF